MNFLDSLDPEYSPEGVCEGGEGLHDGEEEGVAQNIVLSGFKKSLKKDK